MKWQKRGLVYTPPKDGSSALTPTAFLLNELDLDAKEPSKISDRPVLDIGKDGMVLY